MMHSKNTRFDTLPSLKQVDADAKQKYHSIQALGQDVNDVLKTAEAASAL